MDADKILQELLKSGKISEEDIRKASMSDNEIKQLAESFHSLFCVNAHDIAGGCDYYLEEQLDDRWNMKYHQYWLNTVKALVKSWTLDDLKEELSEAVKLQKEHSGLAVMLAYCLVCHNTLEKIFEIDL